MNLRSLRSELVVAAVLLAVGSVSNHWFDASAPSYSIHEGVLYSKVCGFDLDGGADALQSYARYRETPPVWSCEHQISALRISEAQRALHVVVWLAELLCVVAGLAAAVLLIALARGRRVARYVVVVALIALAAAIVVVATAFQEGYKGPDLGYAVFAFVAGALLAVWGAWRASRSANFARGAKAQSTKLDGFMGEWTVEQGAVEAEGKRDVKLAWGLGGLGVAAIVAGGVLYYLGGHSSETHAVSITPTDGGAQFAWGTTF